MQKNPGKRVPEDYELFPGKLDHTTCLTVKIGKRKIDEPPYSEFDSGNNTKNSSENPYGPIPVNLKGARPIVKENSSRTKINPSSAEAFWNQIFGDVFIQIFFSF